MALYRHFVVVTMSLLIAVSLLQPTFSHSCDKSERKRGKLSMEYLKLQHDKGITKGVVVNSTNDQTLSKLTDLQIQRETASRENGQNRSLKQRKLKPKFQCKRQIPGGPDPQHH
ncbi:hypothetical protein SUGI_0116530 [Cryptomeria japonica]|nr:hypothetical protein SUGI_0116530 [Cryptomeria japonica]